MCHSIKFFRSDSVWETILSGIATDLLYIFVFSVPQKDTSQNLPGYWGDMLTSPYIGFGLGEDAVKYRKVCNNVETVVSNLFADM